MMNGLPFDLVDESKLDPTSLEALNSATDQFSHLFSGMANPKNTNYIIPEYDQIMRAIATVIDNDYLAIHRIRERTEASPMMIYSYVTFFGDRTALRAMGYDPLDENMCFVALSDDVMHAVCPIALLDPIVSNALLMSELRFPLTTSTTPFYVSDPEDKTNPLIVFERDVMVEIN